jgi:hypothetical protein
MIDIKSKKNLTHLLYGSAVVWCLLAVYSYYPVSNLFSYHAISLSILILLLVCSYIEGAYSRYSGGIEKQQHQLNHKYGMIISFFTSFIGAAFMLLKRWYERKGFLLVDRTPTYHSTAGLFWLFLTLCSSSSGWIAHVNEKSLSANAFELNILKSIGNGNLKKGRRTIKQYHRYFSFFAITVAFLAVGLGLHKTNRVMLSYSLIYIYILMCLLF